MFLSLLTRTNVFDKVIMKGAIMSTKVKNGLGLILFYLLIFLAIVDLNARMIKVNKIISSQSQNVNVAYNR